MAQQFQQYTIRYVNGFLIRNTIDDDFGIIHRHPANLSFFAPKFYIPADEIWIDAPHKHETDFLIAVEFFSEKNNIPSDSDYHTERKLKKEKLCTIDSMPPYIMRNELRKSLTIVYVDGSIIRRCFDPEFILGGHDLVYDYIPNNTIWIDAMTHANEIPYIIEHECIERELMTQGKSYDVAHEYATIRDKELRRKNGVGFYPGDQNYPWYGLSNEDIRKNYYVLGNSSENNEKSDNKIHEQTD